MYKQPSYSLCLTVKSEIIGMLVENVLTLLFKKLVKRFHPVLIFGDVQSCYAKAVGSLNIF